MTGYCGEDCHDAFAVDDNTSEDEINNLCYDMCIEHAESYGHYVGLDENGWEYEPEYDWWYYKGAEDDMYRAGGGSFEEDF